MFYSLETVPEAVFFLADAVPTAIVTIPWGAILADSAQYIAVLLAALVAWSLKFLPAQICAFLMTMRVDQLLTRAIVFGANSVAGAAPGQTLNINVANGVLKEALTFAILHGGAMVKRFAGSPVDLAEKIWARLPVDAAVAKPDFGTIAAQVALTLPAKA